jgi:phage protein D
MSSISMAFAEWSNTLSAALTRVEWGKATKKTTAAKKAPKAKKAAKTQETGPREGSKTAQVVAMLQRKNGATLPEIMKTMGWQKHTVRGFMAGAMKKAGYSVESFKSDKGERTYRINQ